MVERKGYAWLAYGVLAAEIVIAAFVDDRWIRPLVGDALAVVLVYLALRAALPLRAPAAMSAALLVATVVELGQIFGVLNALGLEKNALARVVFGSAFDPFDFLAYATGAACVGLGEGLRPRFAVREAHDDERWRRRIS